MQITPIPCLTDNYAYIINDNTSKVVGVVDPSEASPIISFLNKKNIKIDQSTCLTNEKISEITKGNMQYKNIFSQLGIFLIQ